MAEPMDKPERRHTPMNQHLNDILAFLTLLHNIRAEQLALVITVNAWGGLIMIAMLIVLSRCG